MTTNPTSPFEQAVTHELHAIIAGITAGSGLADATRKRFSRRRRARLTTGAAALTFSDPRLSGYPAGPAESTRIFGGSPRPDGPEDHSGHILWGRHDDLYVLAGLVWWTRPRRQHRPVRSYE